MSFDAEAFFGGRKSKNKSNGIPDLDDFIRDRGGVDFGSGFIERVAMSQRNKGSYDDMNNNGFVDDLDFAHPPKSSGKRTRQARLLGTDENNVAFGLQKFGNAVGRSESDIGRVTETKRNNKKRKLKAMVELAERNPKKYNVSEAYERLDNFEENELRRKTGKHLSDRERFAEIGQVKKKIKKKFQNDPVVRQAKDDIGYIKNEIGYRVSKSRLAKKIKQLEEIRRADKRLEDPETRKQYKKNLGKIYDNVPRHNEESQEDRIRHNRLRENLSDRDRNELR